MKKNNLTELKRIYHLRQLQGIIPFSMTFEEYIALLKGIYK